MRTESFLSMGPHEFHRVVYSEWGDADTGRTAVCVHGLTRNGRDFDDLAGELALTHRVICPDMAGRGRSEWLPVKQDYMYPLYCADMSALLARLGAEEIDWVGTSMGGIIGMLLAAQPGSPIRRLVLNDVGPFIPQAAVERIRSYVGEDQRFRERADAEAFLRQAYEPFGPLTDEQWAHIMAHSIRETAEDDFAFNYDPGIGVPLKAGPAEDVDLWGVWDRIRCPVLLLRGERSDVLLAETAEQMKHRGPNMEFVEFPRIGHAPTLMAAEQIQVVADFLK